MSNCSATQQGDEMYCSRCALRWPVADVDPPGCMLHERRQQPRGQGLPPMPARPLAMPSGSALLTRHGSDGCARVVGEVTSLAEPETARRQALVAAGLHDRVAGVDYAALLTKYVAHVGACSGSDFVESRPGRFTPDELRALQAAQRG